MTIRKKRLARHIAVALTLVLLAGQSHLATFAQEENVAADTEASVSANTSEDAGEEVSSEETISGNDDGMEEVEVPEEALTTAADGIETYASDIYVDHVQYGIQEQSGDIRQVQVIGWEEGVASELVIPSQITYGGETWDVVSIAREAFKGCQSLVSLEISGSVQTIGRDSFLGCKELTRLTLHEGTKKIDRGAFQECFKLESINIPDSVTEMGEQVFYMCRSLDNVNFGRGMDIIPYFAFHTCRSLSKIYIPNSVKKIDSGAFRDCVFDSIEIPQSVNQMMIDSIMYCPNLKYMKIDVDAAQEKIEPITIELYNNYEPISAFLGCPRERYIVFMNADGTQALSGEALEKAKAAYAADEKDGNAADNMWYGWSLGEAAVETNKYTITINVKKDGQLWAAHGRTFALKKSNEPFITDLTRVENGTYDIYDITGVNPDSYYSKAVDTGMDVRVNEVDTEVDVTVENADAAAEINYYTATFYDGDVPYGDDTLQRPQIVLSGKQAVEPEKPTKSGNRFDKWVTRNGGTERYDFNTNITNKTDIYASWISDPSTLYYTITASSGAGGTIEPIGRTSVQAGTDKIYTVTPSGGYHIASVKVDLNDVTEQVKAADNTYTFSNVSADHTIRAEFEKDENSSDNGSGDNSGGGNGNDDGDNSGGGNGNDDGDNSGGGNDNGSGDGDNSGNGSSGSGSSDGNVSGGSSAGVQSNADAGSREPKTGDTSHPEIFATAAMIAGLIYLILCFAEEACGMTEREKEAFVAALISWAKKGGAFRRCCAMAAICCLLAYYHSIGKCGERDTFRKEYMGQMS